MAFVHQAGSREPPGAIRTLWDMVLMKFVVHLRGKPPKSWRPGGEAYGLPLPSLLYSPEVGELLAVLQISSRNHRISGGMVYKAAKSQPGQSSGATGRWFDESIHQF